MGRRDRLLPLMALALMALAALTCNRSAEGEPTLAPTNAPASASDGSAVTPSQPTAVVLATPTVTPSPIPTATPTPTATPLPAVLIERAEEALHNGNYAAAQAVYQELPVERLDVTEAAQTRFGLAQSLLEAQDFSGAAAVLREFLIEHPDASSAGEARFLLAEALMGSGDYLGAVEEYRAYLDGRDVLEPYVQMWVGDALTRAEQYDEAVVAYELALTKAPTSELILQVREKMALALGYTGDLEAALVQYDAILATAESGNLKARIQYQAAQTQLAAGDREAAYERLYDVVANYYKTGAAYSALVDLINSNQPVDEFQRGLVDYYNDAYDAAITAFYRAIELDPSGHIGAPHYYAGLAYRDAHNYAAALIEFDKLINTHPGDPYEDDGWLAKAWTQYIAGDTESALATYDEFVAGNPLSDLAPEALWWAANVHFWDDDCAGAEPLFSQLAADYPKNEYAADALYRAAFCSYQMGDDEAALAVWQSYSELFPEAELVAGSHFWRGRVFLEAGETVSATLAFEDALAVGPLDYYSQRASDLLTGLKQSALDEVGAQRTSREPFAMRPLDFDGVAAGEARERAEADGWLAGWMGLSPSETITVGQLSPVLAADLHLQRGRELWHLGRRSEAKEELERLRVDTATDVLAQYQLATFFRDLGLYRSSILAANAAIRLSPAGSPFDAPPYLARLAYPIYYSDLVLPEAESQGLDPLLVFSLIHQESLFEGFATSYAFAHGLMQIIPSTGESIASDLSWPGYQTTDLYRPFISVKFGTYYLSEQLKTFDGLVYPALAAYNAGPGNAGRWLERTLAVCADEADACVFDYDVFVELIDLYETRLYIRQIYKHFSVYEELYARE